jgi:hypothetical protein
LGCRIFHREDGNKGEGVKAVQEREDVEAVVGREDVEATEGRGVAGKGRGVG